MLWFFLFVIWIWLLIAIFADIFRSHDLSGWGKAGWAILVVVVPFIGIFAYLIARGSKMSQHAIDDAAAQDAAFRARVQSAVTDDGSTSQLNQLAALKSQGVISDEEYQRMKAKIVAA
jgi:hypothetical protein